MVFYLADGTPVSSAPKITGSSWLDTGSASIGAIGGVEDGTCPSSASC